MINVLSVQICPVIGRREKNLEKVSNLIEEFVQNNPEKKLDLVVLPEFFNTGVSRPAFERLAEEEDNSPTKEFLAQIAKKYNCFVHCGSTVEKDGEKLYNTARLLDRNGNMAAKYRKMNLFKYFGGTEDQYITPGSETVVVDTELGKIGFATCFDISYPKHSMELAQKGAEIILCPAAWCVLNDEKSHEVGEANWKAWNRARAVDNFVYFVSADLCGTIDSMLSSVGCSAITSYDGETLAEAGTEEGTIFAQLDISALRKYRKKAPIKY